MALLVGVAFIAGIVTAISPCVLPVLPVVFAGGATGGRGRPYAIVAGLVASFTVFTLTATALLSALGLPDDLLRNIAIGVVLVVGLSLVWPPLSELFGRPFHALGRRAPSSTSGGFLLGASLGLLFTPCAGPVIAAVATLAATERYSLQSVLVTLAYALGAGVVLLGLGLAARRGFELRPLQARAPRVRQGLGGLVVAVAVVMALGLDARLATAVPGYTRTLQGLESSRATERRLDRLVQAERRVAAPGTLRDYGRAPDFNRISGWLNSRPLGLAGLRGKVVLLDFWTYSCVNCLRTLPHVKAWWETYRDQGLVIVGVHTPEFAFEREPANVERAIESLGIDYPVALDNDYGTWTAWGNRYWPAKYFIDRRGHVRFAHFGEGEYERSEQILRQLLDEPGLPQPVSAQLPDATPSGPQTPETYLGYARFEPAYAGSPLRADRKGSYTIPEQVPLNGVAYGGQWIVEAERIVAGRSARLRLAFHAKRVFLVLGTGTATERVEVAIDGRRVKSVRVVEDRLYTLLQLPGTARAHTLDLSFTPGTEAYAFTFG